MNTPLRVAIVGCGNVALNFHVPAYQAAADRYRIVGLADPTPERLELGRATAGLDAGQVHLDAADLLARDDVDVCTPQHLHRDLVIAAVAAGKHVLCEKPIAAVPADAAAKDTSAADGAAALHTLHTTVAAYASAALGRTIAVPLPADEPLHRSGVVGLRALEVPESSHVRIRGLFGLTPVGA
jgi:hypothetical protein